MRRDFPLVAPADPQPAGTSSCRREELPAPAGDLRHGEPCRSVDTLIISLLNGISSEEALAAAFGEEKVPIAMILGIDAVREGNATRYSGTGKIHFGDARNTGGVRRRVTRITRFLEKSGVAFVVPPDMVRSLWYKFMINVGINQASAVLRAPYGVFQAMPEAKEVMESAMRETVVLFRGPGHGAAGRGRRRLNAPRLRNLAADGKTSMLQDVEARRKTEVNAFPGGDIRLADAAGVAYRSTGHFSISSAQSSAGTDARDSLYALAAARADCCALMIRSESALKALSIVHRSGCASSQRTDSLIPAANGTVAVLTGNKALDLGVVEHGALCLVPDEASQVVGVDRRDEVRE